MSDAMGTATSTYSPEPTGLPPVDIAGIVPSARHIYPGELEAGDLLFDTTGALQPITEPSANHDGKIVFALLENGHRAWFWNDEPIIAVLPRSAAPTITVYERIFDPDDAAGWADGNPHVIDADTETHVWEPDDGNPVTWAVGILNRSGTLEPSSTPPFTKRTWYSGSSIDFARDGATVEISAHLAGFTLAEAEKIGTRIISPPARQSPAALHGLSRSVDDASRARTRIVGIRGR